MLVGDESENYSISRISLLISLVGIVGLVAMYVKKYWGLVLCASALVLQILIYLIAHMMYGQYYGKVVLTLVLAIIFSLSLFINNDGRTSYFIIKHNGVLK